MNKTTLFLERIGLSSDMPVTYTIDFLNQIQSILLHVQVLTLWLKL